MLKKLKARVRSLRRWFYLICNLHKLSTDLTFDEIKLNMIYSVLVPLAKETVMYSSLPLKDKTSAIDSLSALVFFFEGDLKSREFMRDWADVAKATESKRRFKGIEA